MKVPLNFTGDRSEMNPKFEERSLTQTTTMEEKVADSAGAPPTACQEDVDKSLLPEWDIASEQKVPWPGASRLGPPPEPNFKDRSLVAEYLAIKRLINEGSLTVSPGTAIGVWGNGRWSGLASPRFPFNYARYPCDLYISSSELTRHYTFAGPNSSSASSIKDDGDTWWSQYLVNEYLYARPYTAHPVWNSVVKRGPMGGAELEAVVEEADIIEEADHEIFEEALMYCESRIRPGSAPLEGLPFQLAMQKLLSALHRLSGEMEDESFSNMTEDQTSKQTMLLRGLLLLRDPDNALTFIQLIKLVHFCMLAPEIPLCVTVLVSEHAAELRKTLFARRLGPKLKRILDTHSNRHNE